MININRAKFEVYSFNSSRDMEGVLKFELFSLRVTVEALLAKIDRKSAISLQRGQFDPDFR